MAWDSVWWDKGFDEGYKDFINGVDVPEFIQIHPQHVQGSYYLGRAAGWKYAQATAQPKVPWWIRLYNFLIHCMVSAIKVDEWPIWRNFK